MIFRNELKELMTSLYLTKEIENELKKAGAQGNSLSDKVKSFQTQSEEEFEEYEDNGYSFRQYKKALLGGHYNQLRWVAHERNQLMHQSSYYIFEFAKFKRSASSALSYIKNGMQNVFNIKEFVVDTVEFIFYLLPFLVPFIAAIYTYRDKFSIIKFDEPLTYLYAVLIFVVFVKVVELSYALFDLFVGILTLLKKLMFWLQIFLTRNRGLLLVALLAFYFWDMNLTQAVNLFQGVLK
jgi:hypothetical protein